MIKNKIMQLKIIFKKYLKTQKTSLEYLEFSNIFLFQKRLLSFNPLFGKVLKKKKEVLEYAWKLFSKLNKD